MYRIIIKKKAKKFIDSLPRNERQKIVAAIEQLSNGEDIKELYRNKLSKAGEGFFVGSKAEKHSHTWCMASFDNAAADEKDKPDCAIYFDTVPKALKGHAGLLRLRVGSYRIIYTVDHGDLIVYVIDAGNRRQIYNRY